MQTVQTKPSQLSLTHGGGTPVHIDADLVTNRTGTVRQVLSDVVREHVNDPDLLATLQAQNIDIDLFPEGSNEATGESHVSPDANWRDVVAELEKQNVELGVAEHIRGGAHDSHGSTTGHKHCKQSGKSGASMVRSPPGEQAVIRHPPDYQLTDHDRAEILAGTSLFFTGEALAKANLTCQWFQSYEILWYWTAVKDNELLISDIVIPAEQQLSGGSCEASGSAVLAANREARRRGSIIVGGGHSHGWMAGNFSSGTDLEALAQLAAEKVGFASVPKYQLSNEGRLKNHQPLPETGCPAGPAKEKANRPENEKRLEFTFDRLPGIRLDVTTADHSLSPEQLSVELRCDQQQRVSTFTTHNLTGQRFCPTLRVGLCSFCRRRTEEHISIDVTIHVVGPEELTGPQHAALCMELQQKTGWSAPPRWGHSSTSSQQNDSEPKSTSLVPTGGDEDGGAKKKQAATVRPADFQLSRHGQLVGRIPAALMEQAAHLVPALAVALDWDEEKGDENDEKTG